MRHPPHRPPARAKVALVLAILLLVMLNVGTAMWRPGPGYVPLNLGVGAILVVVARWGGSDRDGLGLSGSRVRAGLRLGATVGVGTALLVAFASAAPWARPVFQDARAADVGAAGLAYQVLVRIPLGTALFEEVAFRGVILDLARKVLGPTRGAATSAILFGLWHVAPARSVAAGNAAADGVALWIVILGAVAATAAAAAVFTWLRDRSGSLLAPMVAHAAVNSSAFAAAWWVLR